MLIGKIYAQQDHRDHKVHMVWMAWMVSMEWFFFFFYRLLNFFFSNSSKESENRVSDCKVGAYICEKKKKKNQLNFVTVGEISNLLPQI